MESTNSMMKAQWTKSTSLNKRQELVGRFAGSLLIQSERFDEEREREDDMKELLPFRVISINTLWLHIKKQKVPFIARQVT